MKNIERSLLHMDKARMHLKTAQDALQRARRRVESNKVGEIWDNLKELTEYLEETKTMPTSPHDE
jgi:hypothetical protein